MAAAQLPNVTFHSSSCQRGHVRHATCQRCRASASPALTIGSQSPTMGIWQASKLLRSWRWAFSSPPSVLGCDDAVVKSICLRHECRKCTVSTPRAAKQSGLSTATRGSGKGASQQPDDEGGSLLTSAIGLLLWAAFVGVHAHTHAA